MRHTVILLMTFSRMSQALEDLRRDLQEETQRDRVAIETRSVAHFMPQHLALHNMKSMFSLQFHLYSCAAVKCGSRRGSLIEDYRTAIR